MHNFQESCTYNSIIECTYIKLHFENFASFREKGEGTEVFPGARRGAFPPLPPNTLVSKLSRSYSAE